ncbi:MAG: hypothetical protein R6V07_04685 [Armatimonadota bacterium]
MDDGGSPNFFPPKRYSFDGRAGADGSLRNLRSRESVCESGESAEQNLSD